MQIGKASAAKTVAGGFILNFAVGFAYIWNIISNKLVAEQGWTAAQASFPFSLHLFVFVISMVLFGKLQDKKGPKICAAIAAVVICAGMILSSIASTPAAMAVCFGGIGGFGVGAANTCGNAPSLKWFPKEKHGIVSGFLSSGVAGASFMYAPVSVFLMNRFGIPAVLIFTGIVCLVNCMIAALLMDNPPEGYRPEGSAANTDSKAASMENDYTLSAAVRDVDFYLLWFILTLSCSAVLMVWSQASAIARINAGWNGGMTLTILLAACNFVGRIGIGIICDRIRKMLLLMVLTIIAGVDIICFGVYTTMPLLILGVVILGLYYGGIFPIFAALTSKKFGVKNYAAIYAALWTGWGISGVIGPMIGAGVYDATGGYNLAYIISCVILLITLVLIIILNGRFAKTDKAK